MHTKCTPFASGDDGSNAQLACPGMEDGAVGDGGKNLNQIIISNIST